MKIVVAVAQRPFAWHGPEDFAQALRRELRAAGHQAEIVRLPFQDEPPERMLEHVLAAQLLTLTDGGRPLGDALIALELPVYLLDHPNKIVWLARYRHSTASLVDEGPAAAALASCLETDRRYLPQAQAVYTVSATVSRQLRAHTGLEALPLVPPPHHMAHLRWEPAESYFLVPPGIDRQDRLDALVGALAAVERPTSLVCCGPASATDRTRETLRAAAERYRVQDRVQYREVNDGSQLGELYARCRAVLYPACGASSYDVALSAMLASKPLLTTHDAGAPAELVEHEATGLLVEADGDEMKRAMNALASDPFRVRTWGVAGREAAEALALDWSTVLETLLPSHAFA